MNSNKDDFQLLIKAARRLKKLEWTIVQIKRNSPSYEEACIRLNYTILEVILKGNKLTLMEDGVFITSFQIQDFFFLHIVLGAHEALGHSTKKEEMKRQELHKSFEEVLEILCESIHEPADTGTGFGFSAEAQEEAFDVFFNALKKQK